MKKRNRIEFYNLKGDVGEFFDFNYESDLQSCAYECNPPSVRGIPRTWHD